MDAERTANGVPVTEAQQEEEDISQRADVKAKKEKEVSEEFIAILKTHKQLLRVMIQIEKKLMPEKVKEVSFVTFATPPKINLKLNAYILASSFHPSVYNQSTPQPWNSESIYQVKEK